MSDFFHSKGKLSRFLAGKGFYAALAVCVIGAGAAAWVAVDKTVDRIDESNRRAAQPGSQAASSAPEPSYGFPDLEEAGKAQSGVGVQREKEPSSSSSSSTAAASSSAASSAPEAPSVEAKAQPELEPSSFVLPISGEIFVPYSGGELVKDPTLNEWRTHDGIDIKAEPGTPVKAVCDGQVTAVTDDPLMGRTVEILHQDGITSVYCGLDQVQVAEGDAVKVTQPIGMGGEVPSEIALDPPLHFAIKVDGQWADPLKTMGKTVE